MAAEKTAPQIGVDEQLVRLLSSPIRMEILVVLIERTASPKEIAGQLKKKLNDVSYHVQELLKMGYIELVGEEPRRGQVAHLYRAVMRPIWNSDDWGQLSQEERERYAAWVVQLFNRDVVMALSARTFQARADAHTSRSLLRVDEQGWRDLNRIQDVALKAGFEVEAESVERLKNGGESISVRTVMFCFEAPPTEEQSQ